MSKSEIRDVFLNSKAVIDIQHPEQTGLTMRSIEMLGLNKKLITTNVDIRNYDFFNGNNIVVINRSNPSVPDDFIDANYIKPNGNVVSKYSIQSWLSSIFSGK